MKTVVLNPFGKKHNTGNFENDKWLDVGGNPGNLIFYESVKSELNYKEEINISDFDKVDENTVVVIPSSNFLMPGGNDSFYEKFIRFLDNTNCQVTMVGLGAQSSWLMDTPGKLVKHVMKNPIKVEFFRKMSERTTLIGVRGEFTAVCLDLMGIHNYKVIGCPSFFVFLDGNFPDIKKPDLSEVQMTVTPGSSWLAGKLMSLGMKGNYTWVKQSKNETPEVTSIGRKQIINPKWRVKNFPGLYESSDKIIDYIVKCQKTFFSIDSWKDFYSSNNITFAFGTRFHGNMAALQNGVPALWITRDSRTRELTEFLKLPAIDIGVIRNVCGGGQKTY